MPELLPLFLNLTGRSVVLVGGGRVATAKLQQLEAVGAEVTVVAPQISEGIRKHRVRLIERGFEAADLDAAWLAVAAATPEVNRLVGAGGHERPARLTRRGAPPSGAPRSRRARRPAGVSPRA